MPTIAENRARMSLPPDDDPEVRECRQPKQKLMCGPEPPQKEASSAARSSGPRAADRGSARAKQELMKAIRKRPLPSKPATPESMRRDLKAVRNDYQKAQAADRQLIDKAKGLVKQWQDIAKQLKPGTAAYAKVGPKRVSQEIDTLRGAIKSLEQRVAAREQVWTDYEKAVRADITELELARQPSFVQGNKGDIAAWRNKVAAQRRHLQRMNNIKNSGVFAIGAGGGTMFWRALGKSTPEGENLAWEAGALANSPIQGFDAEKDRLKFGEEAR